MRNGLFAFLLLGAAFAAGAAPPAACDGCGSILGVREIPRPGGTTGTGMAAGAVIGALLGNRLAGSPYRTSGAVLGAAGGAMAGHVYERETMAEKSYEIGVRFDDGSLRLFTQDAPPAWTRDDRVRVVNGVLTPVQQSGMETK